MNLKSLMNEYFENEERFNRNSPSFMPQMSLIKEDVPVKAKDAFGWELKKHPNRLVKKFNFNKPEAQRNFVLDLLEYEEEFGHNAKIIISGKSIKIEVFTHYLEDITEMDKEYADVADEIYKDSNDADDE